MKKIQIILVTLMTIMLGVSCEDDGGTSVVRLEDGAAPNIVKSPTAEQFIDLLKVEAGEPVSLAFTAEIAQGTPASTDIVGSYKTSAGPVYTAVLFSNVTLPQEFNLSIEDIIAAFSEFNSNADILLGDVLTITTRFTMNDGRVLDLIDENGSSNTGTNIQTTVLFTTTINYPISCATALEGDYISTVISSNIPVAGNFRSPQPVTITQPSAGTYILSDGTADIFGPDFPIGLTFTDVCETISVLEPSVQYPGVVDFIDNGATLDTNTGIITMNLEYTAGSCCGLPGIKWTLELTPN